MLHCTHRDRLLLNAIYLTPLTIDQMLQLSQLWPIPFTSWKSLYRRLTQLRASHLVRAFEYALPSSGRSPSYYRLTLRGYRLLQGDDRAIPPTNFPLRRLSPALHSHTFALSRFVVRTMLAASKHGVVVTDCHPENTIPLHIGGATMFPDFTFSLLTASGHRFNFCVEIDMGTEAVNAPHSRDSIVTKLRRYEELHYAVQGRFRVLFMTTSTIRSANIAVTANEHMIERRRSFVATTTLDSYCDCDNPLTQSVFLDHQQHRCALLPLYLRRSRVPAALPDQLRIKAFSLARGVETWQGTPLLSEERFAMDRSALSGTIVRVP